MNDNRFFDETDRDNDIVNNYLNYSRNYLTIMNNMMILSSRNDERIYNLMRLSINNNRSHESTPINNNIHATTFTSPFNTRNTNVRNTNVRNTNVRNTTARNTTARNTTARNRRSNSYDRNDNRRNIRQRQNRINEQDNDLLTRPLENVVREAWNNTDLTNLFIQAFNNASFESVPIVPTTEQINNACEDLSYNSINNPINSVCPINLERFDESSTVTQIVYCGHCYSPEALRRWFSSNVRCPICRYDIREYNPLRTINNPYRRIIRNPNVGVINRPNNNNIPTSTIIEPTVIPNSTPTFSGINIDNTEEKNDDENGDNDAIADWDENELVDANEQLSEQIRDNLNNIILNDLSASNINIDDLSNNGMGPIIDLSYQIFFN